MTSLGSALALAPPLRTALLLIPSNGVGVSARARTREHFVDVCVLVRVCLSLRVCSLCPLSLFLHRLLCWGCADRVVQRAQKMTMTMTSSSSSSYTHTHTHTTHTTHTNT